MDRNAADELNVFERHGGTLQRKIQESVESILERIVPKHSRHQLVPSGRVDTTTSLIRWRVRSTLDLYTRISLTSPARLRIKHTLFPTRFVALKSQIALARGLPPEVEAELKLLGVLKYTLSRSGPSAQLRIQAPLAVDNVTMDVIYERRPSWGDDVRVAFRFHDMVSIRVPYPLVSLKPRRRLLPNLKTTLRIKRSLEGPPSRSQFSNGSGGLSRNRENSREAGTAHSGTNSSLFADVLRLATVVFNDQPRERRQVERPEAMVERRANAFEATRGLVQSIIKADDIGIDIKYRWLDIGD